jgi:TonB family protein
VLVAGLFRPPTTYDAPSRGEVPKDIASASEEAPFPLLITTPLYPPHAGSHTGHVVLVEVEVGEDGDVADSRIVRSSPGFDGVSLDAGRSWKFRPARHGGRAVSSYVYIVFGFREPVAS